MLSTTYNKQPAAIGLMMANKPGKTRKKSIEGKTPTDIAKDSAFDEEAFSNISKQIEATLAKKKSTALTDRSLANSSESAKREADSSRSSRLSSKAGKANVTAKPGLRGKKRDHAGTILPNGNDDVPTESVEEGEDILRREILALGGTEEDVQLLDGVNSESEFEGSSSPEQVRSIGKQRGEIGKGIANILKEIQLAKDAHGKLDREQDESSSESEKIIKESEAPTALQRDKPEAQLRKKGKNQFSHIVEPRPDWFSAIHTNSNAGDKVGILLPKSVIDALHERGKALLDQENSNYRSSQLTASSQIFYNTVIASGTLSDKISALTLAVQESPLHTIKSLEILIGLAKKRSRAQAIDVLRALKDLFAQGSLLPSDRRLHAFASQPGWVAVGSQAKSWKTGSPLPSNLTERTLIIWSFEDWLKDQYFENIKILEEWCNDELEYSKSRAISYVYELLKEKPEQESNLLRLLINKLGDPIKKVASRASYLLMQLMNVHPAMKLTIISTIESDVLFRPGQNMHAKYYAAVTINQTTFSMKETDVAEKLLAMYFSLFATVLRPDEKLSRKTTETFDSKQMKATQEKSAKQKLDIQEDELKEKYISAVLTGINRAYPYADGARASVAKHMDVLFRITHSSNFNTGIQAMMLLQQLCTTHQSSADRFYRTLYESLLDPRLLSSSKQSLYLNLLYKSLKADLNVRRVKAFVKRILQVLLLHEPSFVYGSFFLLKELEKTFLSLGGLIDQPEDHEDDEEQFYDADGIENPERLRMARQQEARVGKSYDPRKRDPDHCNAENSCLWELSAIMAHYHPSINVAADSLMRHAVMPGKPDLDLHTLIHFLDRFVYRNAKLPSSNLRGSSMMQPLAGSDKSANLLQGDIASRQSLPVNSQTFRQKQSEEVAAEEVFFHKYFSTLGTDTKKIKKAKKAKEDASSDEEEDAETEIWKAMVDSAPNLEGVDNSEDDLSLGDLESAEMDVSDDDEVQYFSDDVGDDDEEDEGEEDSSVDENDDLDEFGDTEPFAELESEAEDDSLLQKKTKGGDLTEARKKKKKLKSLPTFASADAYAKMIEDDSGEEL